MTFNRIKEMINRDSGVAGTLLIPKLIFPTLIEAVDKVLLPRELAAIYQTPAQTANLGSSWTINLETADSFKIHKVGEGTGLPMSALGFSTVTVTPAKYGVSIRITREMQEDSQFELLNRNIAAAGKKFGEKETELVITALHGTTNAVSGGSAITIANITEAMNYLERYDYTATDYLVGDEVAMDLRNIDTFVEVDKSGSREMMDRGFIGTMYGMKVARFSRNATPTAATYCKYSYVIDREHAYGISYKRDMTVENFVLPTYDMEGAAITMRLDVYSVRDYATCEITTS